MADTDTMVCPQCHATVTRRVAGSRYVVCPVCSSWLELKGTIVSVVHATGRNDAMTLKPGMSCHFDGCEWVVTGCAQQLNDDKQTERWMEYKLYCADKGWYRSLVEYRGHWLWTGPADASRFMTTTMKVKGVKRVRDREEKVVMNQYARYNQRTLPVAGEFATDVMRDSGGKTIVEEYEHAPLVLVKEMKPGKKYVWNTGTYLKPRQVAQMFDLSIWQLPIRKERIPAEPRLLQHFSSVWLFFLFALVAVLVVPTFVAQWKPEKYVLQESYEIIPDTGAWAGVSYAPVSSRLFEVTRPGALEVTMNSSLNQEWLEMNLSIMNEQTGAEYSATRTAEYWDGYDADGHWVENKQEVTASFSDVPAGRYLMSVYPSSGAHRPLTMNVSIKECALMRGNKRWFVGILCLTAFVYFLYQNRENLAEG